MGRIGQSLIMLGQPPYCSLFSVWWADDGLRVWWYGCIVCECACARVCVHSRALYEMGQGYSRGKKTPPYLIPHPTPPPHVYASPNWILYYRSSQVWTTHFPLPVFPFSLFHFSFLHSCFIPSWLFFLSVFPSFFLIQQEWRFFLFFFVQVLRIW